MQKKSLLALLLALMMVLSGCALVTVDTDKDNARTIIDVNGETVNKRTVAGAVSNQLQAKQYYAQLYASYGLSGNFSTDEATVTQQVVDSYVQQLAAQQKAKEMGLYEMTEDELAHIEEHAKEHYNSFLDSVASTYLPGLKLEGEELRAAAEKYAAENGIDTLDGKSTLDDFMKDALDEEAIEKLEAYIIKDITVSDEEVQADYDAKVEADKANFDANPDAYASALTAGTTVYYAPAGYRMVKHILVPFETEDSTAVTEKQSALTTAQAALTAAQSALDGAAEDAFKLPVILAHRNAAMQANVPGMFDNTWMTTSAQVPASLEYLRYRGRDFAQVRGYWEVKNDFMGGPFVSHSFYNRDGSEIIVAEAFVYAPSMDKRQFLRQAESILYSWEWKEDAKAAK